MSRATRYEFLPGVSLLTCSAEDLVILKAFADRPRDWGDVETIIARQQTNLDWNYTFDQLEPLCRVKEAPEIVEHMRRLMISQQEQRHRGRLSSASRHAKANSIPDTERGRKHDYESIEGHY